MPATKKAAKKLPAHGNNNRNRPQAAQKVPGKIVTDRGSKALRALADKQRASGRPEAYKPEYDEQARKLMLLMVTKKDMADFFGVSEQSIDDWKVRHPSFSEAIRAGGLMADMDVVASLARQAVGYSYEYEEAKVLTVARDEQKVEVVKVIRHMPPVYQAAAKWLGNRRRDSWADKTEQSAPQAADAARAAQEAIAAADTTLDDD